MTSQNILDFHSSLQRLFAQNMSEEDVLEIRSTLARYFRSSLEKEIEEVVAKKNYSTEDYHRMLEEDSFGLDD